MARIKELRELQLQAYFTPTGFLVEVDGLGQEEAPLNWIKRFEADRYRALFHLGFIQKANWFSPSLQYLHRMAELLILKISQQADLEISRDAVLVELQDDEISKLLDEIPFAIGMEYIDIAWIKALWEALLSVFRTEIKGYDGMSRDTLKSAQTKN